MNVGILTSVHPISDTRVFHKEAKSLLKGGHHVTLIAPHTHDEVIDGIKIKAVKKFPGRIKRMIFTVYQVLRAAIQLNADIYHFHDPELIPVGVLLRMRGKKVIYDVHEYYKGKMLSKTYLSPFLRPILAFIYDLFESSASLLFNAVIVTDEVTAKKFWRKTILIANYPYLPETIICQKAETGNGFKAIYAGGLTSNRGLFKMIEAINLVKSHAQLVLIGDFKSKKDEAKANIFFSHPKIDWLGHKPWPETLKLLTSSNVGLAVFQPVPGYSYYGINVVKLYEYMMLGLPVIVSDFPNLRPVIEETRCGVLVNPANAQEIADAIEFFIHHPEEAEEMGRRGQQAVKERFNWISQETKLLELYNSFSNNGKH